MKRLALKVKSKVKSNFENNLISIQLANHKSPIIIKRYSFSLKIFIFCVILEFQPEFKTPKSFGRPATKKTASNSAARVQQDNSKMPKPSKPANAVQVFI